MEDDNEDHDDMVVDDAPTYNRRQVENDEELDAKFPDRPRNHKPTLYFHTLCQDLLEPLHRLTTDGGNSSRATIPGRHIVKRKGPYQQKIETITRFIQHWRHDVGKDLYPVFRLILPDKDNDRQVYGLKEMALGRLLVKILGLDPKRSDDARDLIHWKAPTGRFAPAGDFPGLCYNALKARAMLTDPGSLTIADVNRWLDELSVCSKRDEYLPILKRFYNNMNSMEMLWLIRIILKQMRIGTGHEVFLRHMHEGAPSRWSSTSSLRTVCWTLYDDTCSWDGEVNVKPFDCFQPQLCKQVNHEFDKIVERMEGTPNDPYFWIQEKLDGERIQMHMEVDQETGQRRFAWFSRNGTDYTYLYGSSFDDPNAAMTRYLKEAFPENIDNIILDGEMIAWDPLTKGVIPFGTLKTVALDQGAHPEKTTGARPLLKIFDCLYCNNRDITKYTLRDRRNLLEQAVKEIPGRMELLAYWRCTKATEIEEKLRQVIAEASEGLVVKNPRSAYTLTVGSRSDAWVKIKPDYMSELGEHLDCIVVGGYYGSGSRGGGHSSFLCGLRVAEDPDSPAPGTNPQKCWSFVKVGGGYTAQEYKDIKQMTQGKWHKWDRDNPPSDYIELAGDHLQCERPDEWIKPEDSVVIAVKATQVTSSDRFRTGITLRFPRFKTLRRDRDWRTALSMAGFIELKMEVEKQQTEKKLEIDRERQLKRRKITATKKKPLTVIGANPIVQPDSKDKSVDSRGCFAGLEFCVLTDMDHPPPGESRRTRAQLEQLIAENDGIYWASPDKRGPNIICVADKKPTNVYALIKKGTHNIVRPAWIIDCVRQAKADQGSGRLISTSYLLPLESSRHLFFAKDDELEDEIVQHVDQYGDSYARNADKNELRTIVEKMFALKGSSTGSFADKLEKLFDGETIENPKLKSTVFLGKTICFASIGTGNSRNGNSMDIDGRAHEIDSEEDQDVQAYMACQYVLFGGGTVSNTFNNGPTTHIVINQASNRSAKVLAQDVRRELSLLWKPGVPLPRIVTGEWVIECWKEGTLLDEDRFPAP